MNRRHLLKSLGATATGLTLGGCLPQGGRSSYATARSGLMVPRGLHVSLDSDAASSRSVTWFTDGVEAPVSYLEFDRVTPEMSAADIQSQPLGMRIDASLDATPGVEAFTHRATATGIDPDTAFRYRVGSDAAGWSPVHVVKPTPPGDFSFVHFGDHGISARAQMLTDQVMQQEFDLLLMAGDLSYANGDQPIWDQWFAQNEPLFASQVLMTAPGNHEQKDFEGDTFKNRFTHPNPVTSNLFGSNPGSTFYSFDYNRVHFLVTTAGALINDMTLPEELLMIETDLALAAARRAAGHIDFIVVMQHFTIWSDQLGRSPMNPSLVALEEDIIVRYGVDLLLVGHDHVYQRSVPMAFGLPNPLGYVQMMVGTGGASIRLFDGDGPQVWSAEQFVGVGFARYEVRGRSIHGQFIASPPTGMDEAGLQHATGHFRVEDEFRIDARSPEVARGFVHAPRSRETLLADFDAIRRHTIDRNSHALQHC